MDFLDQVKAQLTNMSETEKDAWILSQAKLTLVNKQEGFLLSLSGVKKIIDMPMLREIDKFCERVECGEIYFEYETHYYEFNDEGRYMDNWKTWHNDIFEAIPFLNRVFAGCHDLLRLEEYQTVSDILGKVCEIQFSVEEAEESEDCMEEEFFSLSQADEERMFSRELSEVGADWIRAVNKLTEGQDNRVRAQNLVDMLEHPVCLNVKPRMLTEEKISQKIFSDMAEILEKKIDDLVLLEKKFQKDFNFLEKYELRKSIDRKNEILTDIRVKCQTDTSEENLKLETCWKQIVERIKWLSYEGVIDDQPEIEDIQDTCEMLISTGKLEQEDWEVRENVLRDIIKNEYYDYYNCGDVMLELTKKLCTNKKEYLIYADIMDESEEYKEQAAYMYYQYDRDDKYVSYLESHLNQRSKEYFALIAYYQEHDQQENACRVAKMGLEKCRGDLTDIFICLLLNALKDSDQKDFKKLYASAKRRKRVDLEKINNALSILEL